MDPLDLRTVYTVKDAAEAEVIRVALEAEGIRCEIGGEHQAGFTGMFKIDILVHAEDVEKAREFLEEHGRES